MVLLSASGAGTSTIGNSAWHTTGSAISTLFVPTVTDYLSLPLPSFLSHTYTNVAKVLTPPSPIQIQLASGESQRCDDALMYSAPTNTTAQCRSDRLEN